jgi:Rieske Fe-S protein
MVKDCDNEIECPGRREFIVKASVTAGGLILTLLAGRPAFAFDDITVPVDDKSPLNKVGGWQEIKSPVGKIIILRTGDASFVAYTAKCTHKGGHVIYDDSLGTLRCTRHGSRFDKLTGSVVKGPAKKPLPSYPAKGTATSVVVTTEAKT